MPWRSYLSSNISAVIRSNSEAAAWRIEGMVEPICGAAAFAVFRTIRSSSLRDWPVQGHWPVEAICERMADFSNTCLWIGLGELFTYPEIWETTGWVRACPEKAQVVIDILILGALKLRAINYNYKLSKEFVRKYGPSKRSVLTHRIGWR